jgi:1-acyl-sn-glycerol-3-phosphate acyltransferase
VERSWRLVATALAFTVFGLVAAVANLLYFVPLRLFVRNGAVRRRYARAGIRVCYRVFLRLLEVLGIVKLELDRDGLASLAGSAVVVANHPTLLDVLVLLAYIDRASCVVKHSLWRNPFLSSAIRAAEFIPNRDPEQLLRDCDAALRRGEPLIVFPEATRSVPGQPLRLQRGAAQIALEADADVKLVHFRCEPVFLSKRDAWYRVPAVRPCLAARVGASLRAREFQRGGINRSVAARHLTLALQN